MESAYIRGTFILPAVFTLCLFFFAGVVSHGHDQDIFATCVIEPLGIPGYNISGVLKLQQLSNSSVTTVFGHLYGFENQSYNQRGFHVHEHGDLGGNCTAAGVHYNPLNVTHGAPSDAIRHVGDLGNIVVDSNLSSFVNITDSVISLYGNYSIIGRSIVVHSQVDDLGKGTAVSSNTTGNAGYRIGCCIITLDQQTTASPATTQHHQPGSATSVGPMTAVLLISLAGLQLLMKSIQL